MKKETKKKVFNFALATTIAASVVTPLAIVLGKESNLLFNKNLRQTTNNSQFVGSSYINENDYTLDLNSALGTNRTIRIGTSNITKSIPQGYVIVSGDSSNKNQELVCLDKNDPTKALWKLNLSNSNSNTNINIYGVEYTPYDGGRLIVLYSEDANDDQYSNVNQSEQIKFKVFKFLDNPTPELDFAGFGGKYKNSWGDDSGGRLDTWAISPIFNFNDQVTKYLIYCKEQYFINNDNTARAGFYLVDLTKSDNSSTEPRNNCKHIRIRWEGAKITNGMYNANRKIILSLASFEENNKIYVLPLIIDFVDNKLELDIYTSNKSNENYSIFNNSNDDQNAKAHAIQFDANVMNVDSQIFDNKKNNSDSLEKAADLVKSSISSSTFKKTNDGLEVAFAINMSPNGTRYSPHRDSKLILIGIDNNKAIKNDYRIKKLFNNNNSNSKDSKEELWHGYFANEVIAKYGIDSTINNNLTPFISMGLSEGKLDSSKKWFSSVIKNPFSTVNYNFNTNETEAPNEFRVYRVNNGNSFDLEKGIYSGSGSVGSQFGYGQFQIGFPILEYNDEITNNDIFNRNILFSWNNKNKAIIINQKNHGQNINSTPTYGYHTRFSKNEISCDILNLNKDMDRVTEENITSLKDRIVTNFEGKNIIQNSIVEINNVIFNYVSGTITFDLKVSKYFDETGIFRDNVKFFNFTIEGFTKKLPTTIKNEVNLNNDQHHNNIYSYYLIPSINASYTKTDESYWNFRYIILNTLKNSSNYFGSNFRNLTNLSIDEETFNTIFKHFEIQSFDNKNGTINAKLVINKKYVYTDNTDLEQIVVFKGLRQIKETKLISNTKDTPLFVENFSDTNIPYDGNELKHDGYTNETRIITEVELKEELFSRIIETEYNLANESNGFDTGIGSFTNHLPYVNNYNKQDGKKPITKLTKDNIVLENYEFFAGEGILKVDVKLNVWNGNNNELKHSIPVDSVEANSHLWEAPSATWYVSGFRKDNVETKFNSQEVWKLSGLGTLTVDEFQENKEIVEESLLDYLQKNEHLIEFPFWINKSEVLKNIQIEFMLDKVDPENPKQAILNVRFKNNMWEIKEDGKVYNNTVDAKWHPIKISGFLNPEPIKLSSDQLKKIKLSGDTKRINIDDESLAFENIDEDSKQFLQIQYSVDGLNEWFDKDKFKIELEKLNGSLDDENWIIKRSDIQARYALKDSYDNGKIYLEVDGQIVNNNQSQTKKASIIDEQNNNNVKGYINIDKITGKFKAENFEVSGTDKSPKLIIKNVDELNNLFSRYSSDNIFEILYSDNQEPDSFDPTNAIWKSGTITELKETMDLKGTFEKEFSLSFKGTENYEVYKDDVKQEKGYLLKSPDIKMIISIEIENPLKDKDVKFNFKDKINNNQPYFYQNKGGFWVQISDKNSSNNLDFNDFVNELFSSESELEKKESLELAYYVSEFSLSNEKLKEIHTHENLYNKEQDQDSKYGVWKSLDTSSEGWQKELGLLVNDYVIVTIRVKEEKLTTQDKSGYIVKYDEDYIPFQSRVYGYKVKTSEIGIDESSIQLENVGQAESASYGLDGYARLKNVSLQEDQDKNHLGISLKLKYFNDFYRDENNNILVSGSGQVLVKRQKGETSKEYKDQDGNIILDKDNNNQPIKLELDSNSKPTKPEESNESKREIELYEYFSNSFRLPEQNKNVFDYNFFQNQTVEFVFGNKKGQAIGDSEYDYYVEGSKSIKITFEDIKFPINNDSNIRYEFDTQFVRDISDPNKLEEFYENSNDLSEKPINGQSRIKKSFNLIRKENNEEDQIINDLNEIHKILENDFQGQVALKLVHTSINGQINEIEKADITKVNGLKNGDRFKIEIISTSNDLLFAQQLTPLIFTVSGLYEQPIDEQLLKYLRVKQGGTIDGQGSFNILVDDPSQNNINSDLKTSLNGYKFLVRVWNSKKIIKHDWTEGFVSINNLSNGDKVEWKLVSPNGSPLVDSYYNTVANQDKHNLNENKYSFIQINQEGVVNKNISSPQEGIGKNPEHPNEYPENSGLLISGLKSKDDSSYTTISFEEFTRVMNLMNFGYSGINGQGNMISSTKASDVKLNVLGRNSQTFTLDYLIKNNYISFYYNNESLSQINEFNWDQVKDENGNWLTSPGTLSNGDSVRIVYKDPTMSTSYEYYAPVVSGLQNKSDNMSMFSWIGIGIASFVTLGIFAFIYIYVRNRKLK